MILIVAALVEELGIGLDLCNSKNRLRTRGIRAWQATHRGRTLALLNTGIGPIRAEKNLNLFLRIQRPSQILGMGYCGGLDPALQTGDLVLPERAFLWRGGETIPQEDSSRDDRGKGRSSYSSLEDTGLPGTWRLSVDPLLFEQASSAGLKLHPGDALTSYHVIGDPDQKLLLYQRFSASIIDMETAALAKAAEQAAIPLTCVRAVTDGARDEFLAPFSYNPSASPVFRAVKVLRAGSWIRRYSEWRERAAVARRSLRQFLIWYLDSYL